MKFILTDIGSNTIRVTLYAYRNESFCLEGSKKFTSSLAGFMNDGALSERGIKRLDEVMKYVVGLQKEFDVEKTYTIATASLRKVTNNLQIINAIRSKFGIHIQMISKYDEARLGFLGIMSKYKYKSGMSVDIGGGSTEMAVFDRGNLKTVHEISQGSLSLYNEYVKDVLPTREEVDALVLAIAPKIDDLELDCSNIFGIGGTNRATLKVLKELKDNDKLRSLTYQDLEDLIEKIVARDKHYIKSIIKIVPERIHTIIPGIIILRQICRKCRLKEVEVCETGIRDGYLVDLLNKFREASDI